MELIKEGDPRLRQVGRLSHLSTVMEDGYGNHGDSPQEQDTKAERR